MEEQGTGLLSGSLCTAWEIGAVRPFRAQIICRKTSDGLSSADRKPLTLGVLPAQNEQQMVLRGQYRWPLLAGKPVTAT